MRGVVKLWVAVKEAKGNRDKGIVREIYKDLEFWLIVDENFLIYETFKSLF